MSQTLKPKDLFLLDSFHLLTSEKNETLVALYLPLVGKDAFSIYQFLRFLGQHQGLNLTRHSQLLAWLDMGITDFFRGRQKLEALGLMATFYQEETYLYRLKEPLSFSEFFADDILKQLLYQKLGKETVLTLQKEVEPTKKDSKGYQEISASFQSIFPNTLSQMTEKEITPVKEEFIDSKNTNQFDWLFFKDIVEKQGVQLQLIPKEVRKELQDIVTVYGYDELSFAKLFMESMDLNSNTFQLAVLKREIAKEFNQKLQVLNEPVAISEDRYPLLLKSGFTKEEVDFIQLVEKISPIRFLQSIKKQKGGYVSNNERYIIENLHNRHLFPDSVINILVDYILRQQNRSNLQAAYVDAIANTWGQEGIRLPEDAMKKTQALLTKNTTTTKKSSPKKIKVVKEPVPDWVNKPVKETAMSEAKKKAFQERIKKLKESR